MKKAFDEYRPNVAAIILSAEYPSQKLFLLAKRKGVRPQVGNFHKEVLTKERHPNKLYFESSRKRLVQEKLRL